jgi:ubiquitin carboxyl-terminal hydrolase 7
VNTRHEFPIRLDLDKYVGASIERPNGQPFVYELFGVMVHAGDVGGGHYYAYIRPSTDAQWYRFDDDKISLASEEDATEGSFGGPARSMFGKVFGKTMRRQSAYMLYVYCAICSHRLFLIFVAQR